MSLTEWRALEIWVESFLLYHLNCVAMSKFYVLSITTCPNASISVFTARRVCIARTMPWQDVCPFVCPSVCLSVCRTPVLSVNGYTYPQKIFTIR